MIHFGQLLIMWSTRKIHTLNTTPHTNLLMTINMTLDMTFNVTLI